jgi:predicted FMN-binding regulatory protein PaiB
MANEMEQDKVEQTTQVNEETQTPEVEEKPKARTFSQEELNDIVERRLHKERLAINKKIGVDDLDSAINIVKAQKETEARRASLRKYLKTKLKNGAKKKLI